MSSCIYPSYVGQAFVFSFYLPWLITLGLFAFQKRRDSKTGKYGVEFVVYLYGLWLSWGTLLVWILQSSFQVMRGNPYCPDQLSYAYPSMPAFCIASLFAYIVAFTYFWNEVLSELNWVIIIALLFGIPAIFVWFTFNTWSEVFVSMLVGFISSTAFVVIIRFFVMQHFPMLMAQRPWCWLEPVDTMSEMHEERN